MKKIGVLFGCDIYKAHFYRPKDFVFLSREDLERLCGIEAAFLAFIEIVKERIKRIEVEGSEKSSGKK
jgi:hypothetical protein